MTIPNFFGEIEKLGTTLLIASRPKQHFPPQSLLIHIKKPLDADQKISK